LNVPKQTKFLLHSNAVEEGNVAELLDDPFTTGDAGRSADHFQVFHHLMEAESAPLLLVRVPGFSFRVRDCVSQLNLIVKI
jgi:hypothetical protein